MNYYCEDIRDQERDFMFYKHGIGLNYPSEVDNCETIKVNNNIYSQITREITGISGEYLRGEICLNEILAKERKLFQ